MVYKHLQLQLPVKERKKEKKNITNILHSLGLMGLAVSEAPLSLAK